MKFAPSLMCMDFLQMEKQLQVMDTRVDLYHVDIMDGHYCKNITLSPDMVATFRKVTSLPIDCHLMTTDPGDWIEAVAKTGATFISPHAETINTNAYRTLHLIESLGCKKGVVLNPATPLSYVEPYLNQIDLLTLMTVDVGFAGQPFVEEVLTKIEFAKKWREERGYHYEIQIDGSCNTKSYQRLEKAGADILVMGSSGLFGLDSNIENALNMMYEDYAVCTEQGCENE